MPHILLEKCNLVKTPSNQDGVCFNKIAKKINSNNEHKSEYKIFTKYKEKDFLLTLKQKDENYLLKADKVTRISPVTIIKESINAYAKVSKEKILFSNTNNIVNSSDEPINEFHKDIEFFVDNFKTDKKLQIEIGFGSGRHLLHQATKNPNVQFIGLEIHTPSLEQVLKQIKLQNLKNVFVINYDARIFLEFLKSNSVEKIFVHFPVPWDKKPHRRVYSNEFINEALRVLESNGSLELRTDSRKYFDYCTSLLTNLNSGKIVIDINEDLDVSSKYEDRWKKQGKNIYDVRLYCNQLDIDIEINDNFVFTKKFSIENIKKYAPSKPLVYEDYFIHFEEIFEIDKDSLLILITFGNFNRPVSKYLFVENSTAYYFQGNPIPSKSNIKSHKKIEELLSND